MMKHALSICLAALALFARADETAAPETTSLASSATNLLIVSNAELRKGWVREHVMERGTNLIDKSGTIASKADGAAVETVADGAAGIADAAKNAMEGAINELSAVTNQIPERAQHIVLCIRPDLAARATLTFILTNSTVSADGKTLSFIATANRLLSSRPSMTLNFGDGVDADETAKVTWTGDWDTNSVSHAGSAEIPVKYRGRPACLFENVTFGDDKGLFDFGAMVVLVGGKAAWNGTITNALDNAALKVENGFFKENKGASNE